MRSNLFEMMVQACEVILAIVALILAISILTTGPSGLELAAILGLLFMSWECGWESANRFARAWKKELGHVVDDDIEIIDMDENED